MDSEDGQLFVKNLAYFVRTHEKALANALQLQRQKPKHGKDQVGSGATTGSAPTSTTATLANALSRPYLSFSTPNIKPAKLSLTPHHLFYLLSKFEDLGVDVGPTTVRLENLHSDAAPSNYVSFLGHAPKSRGRPADAESLRSVSSVRSVMSSMSSVWSTFTLSNSVAKAEKQMAQHREDIKYLYSCFTKIPALRLAPDHRARLIEGFEEFPFDTAVPLFVFKNVSSLEICDLDFRQLQGWDRISEQLRSLTVKRGGVDDPTDLLLNIVLDDAEGRKRKRSSKTQVPTTPSTPGLPWPSASPKYRQPDLARSGSLPDSPYLGLRRGSLGSSTALSRDVSDGKKPLGPNRHVSNSPPRPATSRHPSMQKVHTKSSVMPKYRRSSGSSGSSLQEVTPQHSASDLLAMGILPSSKWAFLRHLSLAENGLTSLTVSSLAPVASTLQSLDLSGNLFSEIPDALASLTHLRALNLSNCMIDSLSSLSRNPLPAITTLNLRSNRLLSLAGVERLFSLERLDLRDNRLHDPTELARLTGIPEIKDLYLIKNPFTRTHSSYRVTIFNLFRDAPGHVDDVTIDTMAPLYHEKKHLHDRVPEPANKPIIRPPPDDEPEHASDVPVNAGLDPVPPPPAAPLHRRSTSEIEPRASLRRKKGPRRRIVELSQAEERALDVKSDATPEPPVPELTELLPRPQTPPTENDQPATPDATPYGTVASAQTPQQTLPARPRLDTAFTSPNAAPRIRDSSDDDDSPVRSPEDAGSNSHVYRAKMEAMKNELGPNWLAVLNEDRFADTQSRDRSFSPGSRTSTIRPEHASRGVSVGGRTLG